jgi:Na+-driven multidrug efflux pump
MHKPAKLFLSMRALGAPANVLMLAVQGAFRGFKDTKTPVFYIGSYPEILYVAFLPPFFYEKNCKIHPIAKPTPHL